MRRKVKNISMSRIKANLWGILARNYLTRLSRSIVRTHGDHANLVRDQAKTGKTHLRLSDSIRFHHSHPYHQAISAHTRHNLANLRKHKPLTSNLPISNPKTIHTHLCRNDSTIDLTSNPTMSSITLIFSSLFSFTSTFWYKRYFGQLTIHTISNIRTSIEMTMIVWETIDWSQKTKRKESLKTSFLFNTMLLFYCYIYFFNSWCFFIVIIKGFTGISEN